MNKIFKYELDTKNQVIEIPSVHKFLSLKVQNNKPVVYFSVEDGTEKVKVEVKSVMTGRTIDFTENTFSYFGTAMLNDDSFVVHYFWRYAE